MKSKFTPGPWTVSGRSIQSRRGIELATISDTWTSPDSPEAIANAALIAAAPDMLEIVKAYRNLLRTMAHTDGEIATFHHIESVIAKAEVQE